MPPPPPKNNNNNNKIASYTQKKVDDTETKVTLLTPSNQPTASVRGFDNQAFSK